MNSENLPCRCPHYNRGAAHPTCVSRTLIADSHIRVRLIIVPRYSAQSPDLLRCADFVQIVGKQEVIQLRENADSDPGRVGSSRVRASCER